MSMPIVWEAMVERMKKPGNLVLKQDNRFLRRVDWRYLLANPNPKLTVCFNNGFLKQAVTAISASMLSPNQSLNEDCELAVAINPSDAILKSAFSALQPGGEVYTEWYSPLAGGGQGVRQRLQDIGFKDITCYWSWPPPAYASPLFWLPLDSAGIFSFLIKNQLRSRFLLALLRQSLLQIIGALGLQNLILMPVCAIARKPAPNKSAGFQEQLNKAMIGNWSSWGFGETPSELVWMLWTPGHRSINKIIAYVFSGTEQSPGAVVKIARSNEANIGLAFETHQLQALSGKGQEINRGIPRVLFARHWNGIRAIGETFMNGAPLYAHLRLDNYRELALRVTDWLVGLVTDSAPSPRAEWWDRLVEARVQDFENSFGQVFTRQELSTIRDVLNTLNDMPPACEQRDCSPWNILISAGGELAVLDWESAELNGLPLLDLIYFLAHLAFLIDGAMESGQYVVAYKKALNPQSVTGRVWAECEERYCARVGIPLGTIRALRLLTWLIHSRDEHQQLAEDAEGQLTVAALRGSLFCKLVREEIGYHSLN